MDFSDLDQTQAITFDDVEEEDLTDELDSDGTKNPVAFLKVVLQRGLRETTYPLYEGDNIVGRSADSCHICIFSKSLSKEHACIQIINNVHMIFDKQSRNKTRRGKLFLQPEVRYELKDKDEIFFADVKCIYLIENEESRLMSPDQPDVLAANTPEKEKLTAVKTLSVAESESEEEEENVQKRIEETVLSDEDSDPDQSCDQEVYYAATQPYGLQGDDDDAEDDASNLSEKSSSEQKEEKVKSPGDVKSLLENALDKNDQVNDPSGGTSAGEFNISNLDSDGPCHFSMSTLACDKTVLENQTSDSEEDDPTTHCETVRITETAEIESSTARYPQTETNNNKCKKYKLQKRKTETISTGDNQGTLVLEESLSKQMNEEEVPAKMARRSSARRGRQHVTTRGRPVKSKNKQSTVEESSSDEPTLIVKSQDLDSSDSLSPIVETTTADNLRDLKTCVLVEETLESDKSTDSEEDSDVYEPTQAYTMGCDKPTQAYTRCLDEPTQVYPKDFNEPTQAESLNEPTQVYPKYLDEPTQVYPKGFNEPTQEESLDEPTQVYPKGLDEPTQVYPKGFDEPTQAEDLDEQTQADPKSFDEPTQAYAKDYDSSSDTAEDQDETQKFDLLESNTTDTHENEEDPTEKVNNEDLAVEESVSEDDSDLEADSVLKPDLAELDCEDPEISDEGSAIEDKMLHLDVTINNDDNMNISTSKEQMKETSQEVQMEVKSPVKSFNSKKVFDATVMSPVKSPYKSALASKRGLTSPAPKHVAFTEDTKKDSQLNSGKSSPSDKMSPLRQASTSAIDGQTKEVKSTEEVRTAVENPELASVIEEQKVTLQQPDPVNDTPQTTESPSIEKSSAVQKRRGRKPKVKLDSSEEETASGDRKSKQATTSQGESSISAGSAAVQVDANIIPENTIETVGLTEDMAADSVEATNERNDGIEVISITTVSPSIETSSAVQKRRGRKPKAKLDSSEKETAFNDAKSKQATTSRGESSVQVDANITPENRIENVSLAEDMAVDNVEAISEATYTADKMEITPQTTESPSIETSSAVQKRRGRKPKAKLASSEAETASTSSNTKNKQAKTSTGKSSVQVDTNITTENRIENVSLAEDMAVDNVEAISESTYTADKMEITPQTTESPSIETSSAVQKRRGRKPKAKLASSEAETASTSSNTKNKQAKTSRGKSSVQADANITTENSIENVSLAEDKATDNVEVYNERTDGTEEMEITTTDTGSSVVEGSSSTEDFKLSTTEQNVRVSTRRKRVSSHPAYLKDFETATPKASKKETATPKALNQDSKSQADFETATETATPKALKKDSKSKADFEMATETATPKALNQYSKSTADFETATETATPKALNQYSKSKAEVSVDKSVDSPKPVQSRGRKTNRGNKNSTVTTQLLNTENTAENTSKESQDLEDFTNVSPPKKARTIDVPKSKTSLRKSKDINESTSATLTKNSHNLGESSNATPTKNSHGLDESTSANSGKMSLDLDESISTMSAASPIPEGSISKAQSLRRQPKAQCEDKNLKSGGKTSTGRGQRKNTEQISQPDHEMSVASSSSSATASSSKKQTPPSSQKKGDKAISSQFLRRSSLFQKPKVMFTGLVDEPGEKIVKDLGGEIATAIQDCTHLVTDKIRRTVKFLSGLSKGIPIVSPLWLENSKRAGTFLDGHKFLVSDAAIEKQYKFSLSASITKAASGGGLLKDYKVHVTKSVTPTPNQMQEILLCAGAVYLKTMPKSASEKTIVISCPEDNKLCQPAIKVGIPVVEAEFVLTGILRQEVDFKSFSLITEESTPVEKRKRK